MTYEKELGQPAHTERQIAGAHGNEEPSASKTVLPGPIASLVSLATAASSLSIRAGGFIGQTALRLGRLSALSGVELGRATLELVLFQAGEDVAGTSRGSVGRAAAEGLLESSLSMLHQTLIQTSFLVSAGFHLGSFSLSTGLSLSHAILSTINGILGNTDTSKAIATIIVMVQKEFRNTDNSIERVNLGDILSGVIGFALLQRWSIERTETELQEVGAIEVVWDIVVVDDAIGENVKLLDGQKSGNDEGDMRMSRRRHESTVSLIDDEEIDSSLINDDASMMSNASTRHNATSPIVGRPEVAFQQQLMDQLQPGAAVKITSQSVTQTVVTVDVEGALATNVQPPHGYSLVAAHVSEEPDVNHKLVFQNKKRRRRSGSFTVQDSSKRVWQPPQDGTASRVEEISSDLEGTEPGPAILTNQTASPSLLEIPQSPPAEKPQPNEKRAMSPLPTFTNRRGSTDDGLRRPPMTSYHSDPAEMRIQSRDKPNKKPSLRRTIMARTPNMFDFWNHPGSRSDKKSPTQPVGISDAAKARISTYEAMSQTPTSPGIQKKQSIRSTAPSSTYPRQSLDMVRSSDLEKPPPSHDGPVPRSKHRRHASSICSVATTTSQTSMILKSDVDNVFHSIPQALNRIGRLPGQFPSAQFVESIVRFARFSHAAYGSSFLRYTGASTYRSSDSDHASNEPMNAHHSFTSYAQQDPASIILSSHVDPLGSDITGQTSSESGLPLVHYLSLDHDSKAVVLSCRGTLGFEDVLTDMTADYEDFVWNGAKYQVHKGMLESARRLITDNGGRLIATIKAALEEFDDYGVILCGHSLGGGVSAILGIMMAHPNPDFIEGSDDVNAFVTASRNFISPSAGRFRSRSTAQEKTTVTNVADHLALTLPANRPIQVYTYGPAATLCPALSRATRGLIITTIHGADIVPYLSLGTLRDFQAVALAFKTDSRDAKGEVRRRVWQGIRKSFYESTAGPGIAMLSGEPAYGGDSQMGDQWPWEALQSLRKGMTSLKLVPPGECFLIERQDVLRRHAFVSPPSIPEQAKSAASARRNKETRRYYDASEHTTDDADGEMDDAQSKKDRSGRSRDKHRDKPEPVPLTLTNAYKPASHIRLTHIANVQKRFGSEVHLGGGSKMGAGSDGAEFGSTSPASGLGALAGGTSSGSMFADHMPVRYERALEMLGKGLGSGIG
ncbi:MAG: hypothetical protein M1831_004576 [Alyxoria varia]|nr:MAG: hypothetical protein M1831_004576 [Alyxoria varia]